MDIRGSYNKYSDNIKSYVINSKNPYAYASVPRSTARHCVCIIIIYGPKTKKLSVPSSGYLNSYNQGAF